MFTLKSIWYEDAYLGMGEIAESEGEYISTSWNSKHDGYGDRIAIMPIEYTLWGDYVGGTVERANYEYIVENYEALIEGNIIKPAHGDYNGHEMYMLACLLDSYNLSVDDIEQILLDNNLDASLASEASSLLDDIGGLKNYPVICEDSLYQLESKLLDEAFNDYLTWDIMKAIENWYYHNEELDALNLDVLDIIESDYGQNEDGQNELAKHIIYTYYDDYEAIYEDANGPYIDIDRLLAKKHIKKDVKKIVNKLIKKATKKHIKNFWVD